ncbi:MAG: hypothetical protein EKK64_04305 [Neisseriaceae bacterium]|nr:MAG: hypothetical protein EKK64_04305 [Neisseriaceae bacterium]
MQKEDFEKIGAKVFIPVEKQGQWFFDYKNQTYNLAPAQIMDLVLSPLILGVDKVLTTLKEKKELKNIIVGYSENYIPKADLKFNFKEISNNGCIYSIEELNFKGFYPGQGVWVCNYVNLFFNSPPRSLYIKIEENISL